MRASEKEIWGKIKKIYEKYLYHEKKTNEKAKK